MQAVFRIRGYDSFEQIAVGGMAVVYKARKQSIKKTVAIKVLLPHLAADMRFITRFQLEAETAARVQHENIVNVIDYGKSESSYYIVMEYYDGLTVEELLRTQPRLPIDIALSIVLNVCQGLEAAHGENLVHRDIKPANVIFTRQGGIKVADFGLAKAVDKFVFVTQDGKVVGTPAYMSPEQARGEIVGVRSDIFSLGVVAFELLAGRRPFEGTSYSEVVDNIQRHEPPPISSFNPMIEAPFDHLVARMLRKRQEERYAHVAEIVMDLEGLMDRHNFRRDRRALAEFFADPVGYTDAASQVVLERLVGEQPAGNAQPNQSRQAAINHYRKILYLDPGDEGARNSLRRLGVADTAAPALESPRASASAVAKQNQDAEYRVMLARIDLSVETIETFALKLSMRLKSPLPRMRSLVSRTPCTVAQRLPYRKAKWLQSVLEELGGEVRLEEVVEAPRSEERPKEPSDVKQEATNRHVQPERRSATGGIICSRCGWEEDADAKFCSLCLRRFNKTDKLNVPGPDGIPNPDENPLGLPDSRNATLQEAADWFRSVPPAVLFIASAAVLLLVIILYIAR
jgi:serine/threonine protein kinase